MEFVRLSRSRWYWAIALTTALTAAFSLHSLWQAAKSGTDQSVAMTLVTRSADWHTWLLVLPLMLPVVAKSASSRSVIGMFAPHVLVGVPIMILQIVLATTIPVALHVFELPGSVPSMLAFMIPALLPWKIHVYGLIAATLHTVHYYDQLGRQYAKRTRAEQDKRRSVELLAGTAAHDFNNLLTVIVGNASLLPHAAADEQDALADEIQRGVDRAGVVARHLLTLSKGLRVRATRVDLGKLLRDAEAGLRNQLAPAPGLEVTVAGDVLEADVDAEQVRFVLSNLVRAVAEDAPADVPVGIDLRRTDTGRAVFRVHGAGPTLDPEALVRIFEPGASTRRVGFGLGLTAAREIMRRSGGSIEAASGPGGLEFSVVVPVESVASEPVSTDGRS